MPIILAYLRSDKNEKQFWNRTIKNLKQNPDDLSKSVQLLNKYNCIEDTLIRAEHFTNIAIDSLGVFEENDFA